MTALDRHPPHDRAADATHLPDATTAWTREHVERIDLRPEVMVPPIPADFPVMSDEVWLWDTWPLTDMSMRPVRVNGWQVIMGLVASRDIDFDDRHAVARIGWFSSRDGRTWTYRGLLLPDERRLGTRQWSGSAVLVQGRVHLFYTASGEGSYPGQDWSHEDHVQRIVHATGTIRATSEAVECDGFGDSVVVAEGEGGLYQTSEEARDSEILYGFRDPFVFAEGDDVFMLFTGNMPGVGCFTANVGLARAMNDSLNSWQLLPPLLHATGVNQQLERPHLVRRDGLYYLFFITHQETYAAGLRSPDGIYAFVGTELRGAYRPVNGSGAVALNHLDVPAQRYADYVMPNGLVEGFIDRVGERRGGTLAPTLRLEFDGDRISIAGTLGFGEIPAMVDVTLPGNTVASAKSRADSASAALPAYLQGRTAR